MVTEPAFRRTSLACAVILAIASCELPARPPLPVPMPTGAAGAPPPAQNVAASPAPAPTAATSLAPSVALQVGGSGQGFRVPPGPCTVKSRWVKQVRAASKVAPHRVFADAAGRAYLAVD